MATTLLVARHGETDWNLERRWQGHAESDLTANGRAQAQALGGQLRGRGIDAIYSSDLRRARDTAGIVGGELGLPVRVEQALREVDVGEWSGLTTDEIEARYPEGAARRRGGGTGWEHGESIEAMSAPDRGCSGRRSRPRTRAKRCSSSRTAGRSARCGARPE